jgi:hypothetical protein
MSTASYFCDGGRIPNGDEDRKGVVDGGEALVSAVVPVSPPVLEVTDEEEEEVGLPDRNVVWTKVRGRRV